jgi:MoaA/NifB/PqqE/SkfB family radical SAM enzyme
MVGLCKNHGKKVGFTTNGMLLNKKNIHAIVNLQVDVLGVSFAGTTPSTHNRIRKGTDFDTVVAALEYLRRFKMERKTTKPAVHLAYIMLFSNFDELSRVTSLAKKVGAEQVVASNLTLIQEPQLFQEALFNNRQRLNEYRRTLAKIKQEAANSNILFAYRGPGLDEASYICPENVCRACVINVEGEVGPCVFTNPILSRSCGKTADNQMEIFFKGQPTPFETFSFGNIRNTCFTRIWKSQKYWEFRNIFDSETWLSPREILAEMPPSCQTCYKRLISSSSLEIGKTGDTILNCKD